MKPDELRDNLCREAATELRLSVNEVKMVVITYDRLMEAYKATVKPKRKPRTKKVAVVEPTKAPKKVAKKTTKKVAPKKVAPKSIGGGWYLMGDGKTKVHGKKAAGLE